MTLDEVMKLSNDELTRLAATEVMGWTIRRAEAARDWHPDLRWDHAWLLNDIFKNDTEQWNRYIRSVHQVVRRRVQSGSPGVSVSDFLCYAEPIDINRAAVLTAEEAD